MRKRAAFTSIKMLSSVQIVLLISMTFAVAFLLGQEIKVVSAVPIPLIGPGGQKRIVEYPSPEFTSLRSAGWNVDQSAPAPSINNGVAQAAPSVAALGAQASRLTGVYTSGTQEFVAVDSAATKVLQGYGEVTRYNIVTTAQGAKEYQLLLADGTTKTIEASAFDSAANAEFKSAFTPYRGASSAITSVNPNTGCLFASIGCFGGTAGYLMDGLGWAIIAAGVAQGIGSALGFSTTNKQALTLAATAGTVVYKTLSAFKNMGTENVLTNNAGLIGIGVGIAIFVATYKKESQKLVTFQCLPWEPKLGGEKCEECNKDPLRPCSEYRCKSLGQACQLLNPNTDKAACAWVSKGDVSSPTIQEWSAALKPGTLQYTPNRALRPDARGVSIVSTQTDDNCLPAFTNLQFGILTNEPAQCKVDYNRSVNFDTMQYYFGENSFYAYNHTQRMRLPSPNSADTDLSPLLQNDGTFALFVRCRDANGNVNADEYSINFCVSEGPDTTPPIIESTSIEDGSPVRFGADVVPIEVYTNEPATCKWSINDREYAEMENTLRCATDATQINADLQYTCDGNLTGVQNNANKEFYFRCVDQPGAAEAERNEMRESYKLTLRGTQELTLLSAGPNATVIQASTTAVPIELFAETDDGANEGKSTCYFSTSGAAGSYLEFFETGDIEHKQTLNLGSGNYTYALRCVDAGGNAVDTNISFGVGVDKNAPMVTRIYRRTNDALQITTNEDAQCSYSKTNCNFNIADGIEFNYVDAESQRAHVAEWKARSVYYIKCRDKYGNEPSPNSCSIVVSGVDLSPRAVL